MLNPVGNKVADGFFPLGRDRLTFGEFARTFAIFRPQKLTGNKKLLPDDAVNSREAKVSWEHLF